MPHDFHYISKHDPKVKAAYEDLMLLLSEVQEELKAYTFQHKVVGSYSRNMITYDAKSNKGYDFDVNIYPHDENEEYTAKEIKLLFKATLDKHAEAHGFDFAEDSTRVLTIKVKDRMRARIVYSVDFAFVNDYTDEDGAHQQYIRYNKQSGGYTWEEQKEGYYLLPEKIKWIKDEGLWKELRRHYIEKKNANDDPHVHSRSIFAIAVHEICQKNGFE